jgi:thioredoxin-related protein
MKKFILLLILSICFVSCSLDNDNRPNFHYDILSIDSYVVPDTFYFGTTHQIKLFFKYPTTCHSYGGIYFDRYLNERIFAIQSIVEDRTNCEPLDDENNELREVNVNFEVISTETYLFKFYKGKDEEGNNIFEEVEIPVNSD